jgi:hypothetical protein
MSRTTRIIAIVAAAAAIILAWAVPALAGNGWSV